MKRLFISFVLLGASLLQGCSRPGVQLINSQTEDTLALWTKEIKQEPDYSLPAFFPESDEIILKHKAITISYNKNRNIPNWVAYKLTAFHTQGTVKRSSAFLPDTSLPENLRIEGYEYKHSGYDRGHMAPAGDFKWDKDAMTESFFMTNICPQNHTLNERSWHTLEKQCRIWAQQEGEIYIVTGPIVNSDSIQVIGVNHPIVVPHAFFKCILSLKPNAPKAIGFIYENIEKGQSMYDTACSVDEVERITGYDFFCKLEDKLEATLESDYNFKSWGR